MFRRVWTVLLVVVVLLFVGRGRKWRMGWGQEMRRPVLLLTLRIVGVSVDGIAIHGGGKKKERAHKRDKFFLRNPGGWNVRETD